MIFPKGAQRKLSPFFCLMLYLLDKMRQEMKCTGCPDSFGMKSLLFVFMLFVCVQGNGQLEDVTPLYVIPTDHTGGYLGTGMSFADFNGDGKDDLSFGHHNGLLRFYAGDGVGFEEVDLGLTLPEAESKGILWSDVDNDGDQDLLVTYRLAPNKFFLNLGGMVMQDVSETCGIAQDDRRSFGACFGDFDHDGLLDLFISNYSYASDLPGNELYRNLGGGQFQNVTSELGVGGDLLQCFQGQWMDQDRDGKLDLHVVRDRFIYPNLLYRNMGDEAELTFVDVAPDIGLDVAINCMSTSPCDFDRDGDLDVFLSGGLEGNVFLENDGDGSYVALDEPLLVMNEVCWSGQWFDADCNGWEDLHVTTGIAAYNDFPAVLVQNADEPDGMWMNTEGTFSEDIAFFQSPSILSFATATSDFDGDGFMDLVSHRIGETAQVWKGTPNGQNWLKILPVGTISNRDGVGTKLELWIEGVPLYRETYCGENYLGQNSRWEHFGLGEAVTIDSIRVEWSSGLVDVHYEVPSNLSLTFTEGETAETCADNGSGCVYVQACNFDLLALVDDGSCDFSCWFAANVCGDGAMWNPNLQQCVENCPSDLDGDNLVTVEDLLLLLLSFGTLCPM